MTRPLWTAGDTRRRRDPRTRGRAATGPSVANAVWHWRRGRGHARDDRGLATVTACIGALAVISVLGLGLRVGSATIARQRAETAADLGALAGAARAVSGEAAGCARAESITRANHARMVECRLAGLDLMVQVESAVAMAGIGAAAQARARAGPVGSP